MVAARAAGLIRDYYHGEIVMTKNAEIAIIETFQREDLNPIEEAEGINSLIGVMVSLRNK